MILEARILRQTRAQCVPEDGSTKLKNWQGILEQKSMKTAPVLEFHTLAAWRWRDR